MNHQFRLELVENLRARSICEETPRYDVVFNGATIGQLYFNMQGYTGAYLPQPDSTAKLDLGEVSIAQWRKEVARLNRTPVTRTDLAAMPPAPVARAVGQPVGKGGRS